MKKSSKSKAPGVDPYLEGVVAKLVDRLIGLEKKIDRIISQTSARPAAGSGPAPVPAQQPAPRRDRTMYEAVCADCSKVCEVPFRPTEDRPVYCKECWAKRKAGARKATHGMPVLTPVSLPPKPASKLNALFSPAVPSAPAASKKAKKSAPAKKKKKKK